MPNTTVNHKVELPRAAGNGFLKEDCFNCRDDCLLFARKKARQLGEVIRLIKTRFQVSVTMEAKASVFEFVAYDIHSPIGPSPCL